MSKGSVLDVIAKHSENFIIRLDQDLNITYLNPVAEKVFNIVFDQVQGQPFSTFCKLTHLEYFLPRNFHETVSQSVTQVNFRSTKNFSYLIDWFVEPIHSAGILSEVYLVGVNKVLKENELSDYILDIIACIPGSLYWKDRTGHYLGCNQFMAKTSGLNSVYDVVGKTDFDLWPASAKRLQENDRYVIETGETIEVREKVTTHDGSTMNFAGVKMPLRNEYNEIIGVIGNSLDITSQIEAEHLRSEKAVWEKLAKYLKSISSSLAHELKTPLAGIKMGLTLEKQFFNKIYQNIQLTHDDQQARSVIQLLKDELPAYIHRANQMINRVNAGDSMISMQMKNISTERIRTNDFILNSIVHCVTTAVDLFPFESDEMRQKVHICAERDFNFWGDALLTKHVIWNLLNNALFFIKEADKGEITILVQQADEHHFMIKFKDTAKGMLPEQAGKVFDQFYTNREGGTGLGLNFCYLVMQSYQGSIVCNAVEDEFTEFILSFPMSFKQEMVQ